MSVVTFANNIGSVTPISIFTEEVTLDGVTRPALRFKFYASDFSLNEINAMFSKERCTTLTIEDSGSLFVYENYSNRFEISLKLEEIQDKEGNVLNVEVINVVMAKRTELEISYDELAKSLEETQLALLEVYESQGV